ncbi:MAG: amidohydrolase family protein [Planctomycetota bacterium]|jgi:predicted TIM-barrel fold metal-dependent hydrolase
MTETTYTGPIIDGHAMVGVENHLQNDFATLLASMDANGIEAAVVRWMGKELVVDNSAGNSALLTASDRLYGLATVNPWFEDKALDELKRCHELGAKGIFLHPSRQGFMPLEPVLPPILQLAAKINWPVLMHTGTYIYSDLLGLGELARQYPEINFIAGFGGYSDMWFELPGLFEEVPNLYLDASLIWGSAILEIAQRCGAERILFGSAEPKNRYQAAIKCINRLGLSEDQLKLVFYHNAKRIFRL